jgi:hypothetical protein
MDAKQKDAWRGASEGGDPIVKTIGGVGRASFGHASFFVKKRLRSWGDNQFYKIKRL